MIGCLLIEKGDLDVKDTCEHLLLHFSGLAWQSCLNNGRLLCMGMRECARKREKIEEKRAMKVIKTYFIILS